MITLIKKLADGHDMPVQLLSPDLVQEAERLELVERYYDEQEECEYIYLTQKGELTLEVYVEYYE